MDSINSLRPTNDYLSSISNAQNALAEGINISEETNAKTQIVVSKIISKLTLSCLGAANRFAHFCFKAIKMVNDLEMISDPEFEKGLNQWIQDQECKDRASEAAKEIKEAYYNKSVSLNLNSYGLISLPPQIGKLTNLIELHLGENQIEHLPESIGNLVNLTDLDLSSNYIQSLPESIGNLTQLKKLYLSYNEIKHLPESIGNLTQLNKLYLGHNVIKHLPESIGNLVNLTDLDLDSNYIQSLPESIGNLTNLIYIYLHRNQIEHLPESIGNLTNLIDIRLRYNRIKHLPESIGNLVNLTHLNLDRNQIRCLPESIGYLTHLNEISLDQNPIHTLPLSLGQCSELTNIYCPSIPWGQRDAILAMCRALRANEALEFLPTRAKMWQTFAGQPFQLDFIKNLSVDDKQTINEWLTRLERTRDFNTRSYQKILTKSACEMLEYLDKSPSFKEIFFIQVPINLVACGDRAAMSFNELGLAWTCDNLSLSHVSEKEKLNILIQAAKTLALHKALQKCLDAQEKKTGIPINEGVEVYLYYETHLKEKLNLLTFMSDMLYSEIGKRDWIQEKTLIEEVGDNYQECLLALPALLLLCKADAEFNADWQKNEDEFYEEMEKIHPGDIKEGEYKLEMDNLAQKLQNKKSSLMLNWVKSKLAQ